MDYLDRYPEEDRRAGYDVTSYARQVGLPTLKRENTGHILIPPLPPRSLPSSYPPFSLPTDSPLHPFFTGKTWQPFGVGPPGKFLIITLLWVSFGTLRMVCKLVSL